MFSVHYFENKNLLLTQLVKNVPTVGEDLKIKGRKGKVLSIHNLDETKVHVQVALEQVNKNKAVLDTNKKKKK
ncbi:hypothetical protein LCL95_07280 [Bacillus timonensis]|nr:hypothetical protein [Bacillus timonensis]